MRKLNLNTWMPVFSLFLFLMLAGNLHAQEDSAEAVKVTRLRYFNLNNNMQYLSLECLLKKGKVFTPQKHKSYEIYLDSASANLIATVETDENGKAKAIIPPVLKSVWDASPQHTFIVNEGQEELINDYTINKAKIVIDTSLQDGIRNITATVMKMENDGWAPAADVEMKIGIKRLGGILSAGDDETYTTDSTGTAIAEVKKENMPGDEKGNIILVASVEDNDLVGNLLVEKTVPWGVSVKADEHFFDRRSLWATRFKAPVWLVFMASSIIIGVWGTLIYLVIQLIRIKKLGTRISSE